MRDMKDSGVAWIGEIPAVWPLIRFKDKYINIKEVTKPSFKKSDASKLLIIKVDF